MKTNTRFQILQYLEEYDFATPHQLRKHLGISAQALHRQLNKLHYESKINKIGSSPMVVYLLANQRGV